MADVELAPGGRPDEDQIGSVVEEVLAALPAGCTWLLPVSDTQARVVDFRLAAVGDGNRDIYGRGRGRRGALLSELYPSMVGGELWQLYHHVLARREPGSLAEFRYEEKHAGVVADSLFDVAVHPVLGGLLVVWHRLDEHRRRLDRTELLGRLGWAEHDLVDGSSDWSPGMYRIFDRDPALGPLPRAEQAAAVHPDDRGLQEAAWQTLDSGGQSDVTVRFVLGATVKHLRILSEISHDANGTPLKIYAVVQDVTSREESRTEIQRLNDQLHKRELTALAEHRLAAQLQRMIQPLPQQPFALAGLEAAVTYLPAESAAQVGGDWYHAQALPGGQVVLAIGDVAGHGLDAASGMAHLRYGLIAWLSAGVTDPSTVLAHLNRLCCDLTITGTAAVGIFDPASRTLRWARAGHMPPVLARASSIQPVERPPGMLLGADRDAGYRSVALQLEVDDLVLFYTDGLVERRNGHFTDRLTAVTQAVAAVSGRPPEQRLTDLQHALNVPSPYDDTCSLAIRILG